MVDHMKVEITAVPEHLGLVQMFEVGRSFLGGSIRFGRVLSTVKRPYRQVRIDWRSIFRMPKFGFAIPKHDAVWDIDKGKWWHKVAGPFGYWRLWHRGKVTKEWGFAMPRNVMTGPHITRA